MPYLRLDTEQAELLIVATDMLAGALTARSARADPERIITDSLILQARKMESVRAQLEQPDPPEWDHMTKNRQDRVLQLNELLANPAHRADRPMIWRLLRELANAANGHDPEPALDVRLEAPKGRTKG